METGALIFAFIGGMIFKDLWSRFIAWLDRPRTAPRTIPIPKSISFEGVSETKEAIPSVPRRIGLAELRRRAEMESAKPRERQDQITENNIKAMEGR